MNKELLLYTTSACHLCEQATELLGPLLQRYHLCLREVEISASDELVDRYGIRIPVLGVTHSEVELGWPFDERAAERYINAQFGWRSRWAWLQRRRQRGGG